MHPSLLYALVKGCCRQVATGGRLCLRLAMVITIEEVLLLHWSSPIVHVTMGTNYCTIEHHWVKQRESALNMQGRTQSPPRQWGTSPCSLEGGEFHSKVWLFVKVTYTIIPSLVFKTVTSHLMETNDNHMSPCVFR